MAGDIAVHGTVELRDAPRERKLLLRVTYPEGEDACPVLVFSHGMFGTRNAYDPLVRHFAEHGTAVVQPGHPDSLEFGVKTPAQAKRAWRDRVRDVKLVLDRFDEIEKAVPALQGRLDRKRVGVGGHSFGAHTSMLVGGVTMRRRSFRDERVRCVLLISPQGTGPALTKESYAALKIPAMVITGSKDDSPLDPRGKQGGAWRREVFEHAAPGGKHLVWIEDAAHGFGGITGRKPWRGSGPKNDDHVRIVQTAGRLFLDAYLKGDATAKKALAGDAIAEAAGNATVTVRRKP